MGLLVDLVETLHAKDLTVFYLFKLFIPLTQKLRDNKRGLRDTFWHFAFKINILA